MFDFEKDAGSIKGFLSPSEGRFLYETARGIPKEESIVELGSFKGRSTICIAKGATDGHGAKVYAVDPHSGSSAEYVRSYGEGDTFKEFSENIQKAGVSSFVTSVREPSLTAARTFAGGPIGLLFIDASHELTAVTQDFEAWFPKLKEGGMVAFHDATFFDGPRILTARILLKSTMVKNPKMVGVTTIFEKTAHNSFGDRINNGAFLLCRKLWGWNGVLEFKRYGFVF
jgi:predicted O-methyltransferase YrrM